MPEELKILGIEETDNKRVISVIIVGSQVTLQENVLKWEGIEEIEIIGIEIEGIVIEIEINIKIIIATEEDKIDNIEDTSAQDRGQTLMTEEEVQNHTVIEIGTTERGTTGIER